MKQKTAAARPLIGWREWAAFPDLGVERIHAKIDTGAKSSAIHAFDIEVEETAKKQFVRFCLHPRQRRKTPEIFCRLPLVDRRLVRSSNGQAEERLVIETRMQLGGVCWPIELTLTNRDAMGFRLLVGRDGLEDRFLIDPAASHLLGKSKKLKKATS